MTENDKLIIEKYLDNSLSLAEQQVFDQRLEDPVFAKEVKLYKEAVQAIYALGDDKLKALLQEEEAKIAPPQYSKQFVPKIPTKLAKSYWWAMAASLLVLLSVGYWFFNQKPIEQAQTKEALFAANFEPYKNYNDNIVRGKKDTALTSIIVKALEAYNENDYKSFLTYFEKADNPSKDALFLMGNAYLGIGEPLKAIPIFDKIAADSTDPHQLQAEWYLALTYLKAGNTEGCRILLEKIKAKPNHPKREKAESLLIQLPD